MLNSVGRSRETSLSTLYDAEDASSNRRETSGTSSFETRLSPENLGPAYNEWDRGILPSRMGILQLYNSLNYYRCKRI